MVCVFRLLLTLHSEGLPRIGDSEANHATCKTVSPQFGDSEFNNLKRNILK